MNWNEHSNLSGKHAFLSPSNYHWLNYSPEKLATVYKNNLAKEEGVELHEFASKAINKRIKLARSKNTINQFVNDAIAYKMNSEQTLYYSDNAFGTADAIIFKDNILRIFDLKTGVVPASFKQLDIYAALFCLEYGINPIYITIEQRIYQNNDYTEAIPDPEYIKRIMDQIIASDVIINSIAQAV